MEKIFAWAPKTARASIYSATLTSSLCFLASGLASAQRGMEMTTMTRGWGLGSTRGCLKIPKGWGSIARTDTQQLESTELRNLALQGDYWERILPTSCDDGVEVCLASLLPSDLVARIRDIRRPCAAQPSLSTSAFGEE